MHAQRRADWGPLPPRRIRRPRTDEDLSKDLSRLLRYRAHKEGLAPDSQGWVRLQLLAHRLNRPPEDVLGVVDTSYSYGVPRFEVMGTYPEQFIKATSSSEVSKLKDEAPSVSHRHTHTLAHNTPNFIIPGPVYRRRRRGKTIYTRDVQNGCSR